MPVAKKDRTGRRSARSPTEAKQADGKGEPDAPLREDVLVRWYEWRERRQEQPVEPVEAA